MVFTATAAIYLSSEAFADIVGQERLQVIGPTNGYFYAGRQTPTGWQMIRTFAGWETVPLTVGATADPAASVASVTVYTVPAGKRALFLGCAGAYVRDANAADVYADLGQYQAGTTLVGYFPLSAAMTASATWVMSWAAGVMTEVTGSTTLGSIPARGLEGNAGDTFVIYFTNDQATDNCGIIRYLYKEVDA